MLDAKKKEALQSLFFSFISASAPEKCLKNFVIQNNTGRVLLAGVGKASYQYCEYISRMIPPESHIIVISPRDEARGEKNERFVIFNAGHPTPDLDGLKAAEYLMQSVSQLSTNDLFIFLVSGGGSALLPAPPNGFRLEDEIKLNKALLRSGAPIQKMNLVRKHFSRIKGGRLAALAYPAKVETLVISDIPDDDISQVASGPTLPTSGNIHELWDIINDYKIQLPESILEFFKQGNFDIPNPNADFYFKNGKQLLASAAKCLRHVETEARNAGYQVIVISERSQGEAKNVAKNHAEQMHSFLKNNHAKASQDILFLSGGETSVTVTNFSGKGGRNGEYLLSLSIELKRLDIGRYTALAADSDGIDGSESNAGCFIDNNTYDSLQAKNLSPETLLEKNNSFLGFKALDQLFFTGATGTNVNDFRAIIVHCTSE